MQKMDSVQYFYFLVLCVIGVSEIAASHCPSMNWMEDSESGKCYRYIKRSWDYEQAKTICRNLQGHLSSMEELSNKSEAIRHAFRVKTFRVWTNSDKVSVLYNSSEEEEEEGRGRQKGVRPCRFLDHSGGNKTHGTMSCRKRFPFVCEYIYEKGMSIKAIVAINISALIFMAFILVICASWVKRYRRNDSYNIRQDSTAPLVGEKLDMEDLTCDTSPSLETGEILIAEVTSEATRKGKRVRWQPEKASPSDEQQPMNKT